MKYTAEELRRRIEQESPALTLTWLLGVMAAGCAGVLNSPGVNADPEARLDALRKCLRVLGNVRDNVLQDVWDMEDDFIPEPPDLPPDA